MHIVCPHCHKTNRVADLQAAGEAVCGACKQSLFASKPVELDFKALQRHIQRNEIPVVVDFWAPWCGPCLSMVPAYADAAAAMQPEIRFAKVDTEAHQQAGSVFGIRSIPTMILFRGGQEVTRISGAMSAEQIKSWIRQAL